MIKFLNKDSCYIGKNVKFGKNVVIYENNHIDGDCEIGDNVTLLPNNFIIDSNIGKNCQIFSSVIEKSQIKSDVTIGPFARVRPGSVIGDGCKIGNFVEIKNSVLGEGCKVAHLSYVGDASVGKRVNVGCGVVFANFDGKVKRGSIVEDNCFIGCNCNIIAPSHIGRGAYIAAATTVCGEVPSKALCVGRVRPKMVEDGGSGRYIDG